MKRVVIATLLAAGLAASAIGAAVVYLGLYDISALDQHLRPTYATLDTAMRRSIKRRAAAIAVPPLTDKARLDRGLALYRRHCTQCHGAPGVAPDPFALGMTPVPANLVHAAREYTAAEIYWVVRNGLKMTGMPAWVFRLPDDDLWAIVAFVEEMPKLSPADYRAWAASVPEPERLVDAPEAPDARRGRTAMRQYACATCHDIPGIVDVNAPVGPPLARMGTRETIAGALPNTPENMVRWLRRPQEVNPLSAMPDLGVTERDARDMAAYLSTLR